MEKTSECLRSVKCEICGGESLVSGVVNTSMGFAFTPQEKIKMQPKQALCCDICKDCGHIQNWHIANPKLL